MQLLTLVLICKIVDQGYDGAGAVSGHTKGLSTRILRINRQALYVHCHSHRLNICVSNSCKVQPVRNVMDNMKDVSYFVNLSQELWPSG